jgi:hypothetical protein
MVTSLIGVQTLDGLVIQFHKSLHNGNFHNLQWSHTFEGCNYHAHIGGHHFSNLPLLQKQGFFYWIFSSKNFKITSIKKPPC